jgi:hypothetical protein
MLRSASALRAYGIGENSASAVRSPKSRGLRVKTRTQDSLFVSRPNMLPQGGSEVLLFYVND